MTALTLLFLAAIAVLLHPRFRSWHRRNEPVFGFLIAVVATLCGVAWGISLGNAAERRKERDAVAKLLFAAGRDAEQYASSKAWKIWIGIEVRRHPGDGRFQMSSLDSADFDLRSDRPLLLDAVLENDVVLKLISDGALNRLQQERARYAAYTALGLDMDSGRALYSMANLLKIEARWHQGQLTRDAADRAMARADSVIGLRDSVEGSWSGLLARVRVNAAGVGEDLENGKVWLRGREYRLRAFAP
jgi:hypothetical protein